jgi:hypothetical protein
VIRRFILAVVLTVGTAVASAEHHPFIDTTPKDATPKALFKTGAAGAEWVDFTLGQVILVPARINGQDAVVRLSNSCDASSIDKAFASSIGIQVAPDSPGSATVGMQVEIGSLSLHAVKTAISDLPDPKTYGQAVLCNDLFANAVVDIDFENHRVAFRDPTHFAQPDRSFFLRLTHTSDIRTVPLYIEGIEPVQAEFFLASSFGVAVYKTYSERRSLLENRPTSARLGPGNPPALEPLTTLHEIIFAGVALPQVPALVWPDSKTTPTASAFIGLGVVSRFHLIIDSSHDALYATPYAHTVSAPWAKERLGLGLTPKDSHLAVRFVAPGSPAQAAGFKSGDVITRIDLDSTGEAQTQLWPGSAPVALALQAVPVGSSVAITTEDGSVKSVRLTDFF